MRTRITLEAGETRGISIGGGRFYYENGSGRISVSTVGTDVAEFELAPGMGFQNREDQSNFFGVKITNLHSVSQTIDFYISYREVFDNRVYLNNSENGNLTVVPFDRTVDKQCFIRYANPASVADALWPGLFIINNASISPAYNLYIDKIILPPANDTYRIYAGSFGGGRTVNDYTSGVITTYPLFGNNYIDSSLGNPSVSNIRAGRLDIDPLTFADHQMIATIQVSDKTGYEWNLKNPLIIGTNAHLLIVKTATGGALGPITLETREI